MGTGRMAREFSSSPPDLRRGRRRRVASQRFVQVQVHQSSAQVARRASPRERFMFAAVHIQERALGVQDFSAISECAAQKF